MNKKIDDWRSIFAPITRFMHGGTIDRGNSDWVILQTETSLHKSVLVGRLLVRELFTRLHSRVTAHSMPGEITLSMHSDWVMLHHEKSTTLRRSAVTPTGRLSMEEHTFHLHSKTTGHSMQWG